MLTVDQIAAFVVTDESETLEFKETTGTYREAARRVCAFLNHCGGQVLFGVTQDGSWLGSRSASVLLRR